METKWGDGKITEINFYYEWRVDGNVRKTISCECYALRSYTDLGNRKDEKDVRELEWTGDPLNRCASNIVFFT